MSKTLSLDSGQDDISQEVIIELGWDSGWSKSYKLTII